jgi:hypothetical protein
LAAEDEEFEGALFVELQANRDGWEFLDALHDVGDDLIARAEVFYFLHLDSYPFWLGGTSEQKGMT